MMTLKKNFVLTSKRVKIKPPIQNHKIQAMPVNKDLQTSINQNQESAGNFKLHFEQRQINQSVNINTNSMIKASEIKQNKKPNVYKNIRIIRKVARFINNLKQRALKDCPQFTSIQSFYLQDQKIQVQKDQRLLSWENPFLNIFQVFFLILIMVIIWINTFQLIIGQYQVFSWAKGVTLICYILWIALKLSSQLKTDFQILSNRWDIIVHYFKTDFSFEIIEIFCLMLQLISIQSLFYPSRIIFLVSIYTYWNLFDKVQNHYTQSVQLEKILIILKLVVRIAIFLHFLSLFLIEMHQIQLKNGIDLTWMTKNDFDVANPFQKYLNGYYWAATTMSTVGFGDITPTNVYQRAVLAFIQIFCCLFFGYCVNIIGNTIGLIGQASEKYIKQTRKLNRYLKTLNLSNETKNQIKQNLYNRHKIQLSYDQENEKECLNRIEDSLVKKIKEENNNKIIQNSKYLKNFTDQTKLSLAQIMIKKIYAPNQILFDDNTQVIKMYLLNTGIVKQYCLFKGRISKPIAKYDEKQNVIGYQNITSGNKIKSNAKADNHVLVYQINRQDFLNVIRKNQNDNLKMNQTKEKIIQRQMKHKKGCLVCQRLTHNVIQCPRIHYIPKSKGVLIQLQKRSKANKNKRKELKIQRKLQKMNIQIFVNNQLTFEIGTHDDSIFQNPTETYQKSLKAQKSYKAQKSLKIKGSFKTKQAISRNFDTLYVQESRNSHKSQTQNATESRQQIQFDKVFMQLNLGFFTDFNIQEVKKQYNKENSIRMKTFTSLKKEFKISNKLQKFCNKKHQKNIINQNKDIRLQIISHKDNVQKQKKQKQQIKNNNNESK